MLLPNEGKKLLSTWGRAGFDRKRLLVLALLFAFTVAFLGSQPLFAFLKQEEPVPGGTNSFVQEMNTKEVVRFHVIAHDDSTGEQELKNLVARRIISEYERLGKIAGTPEEMLQILAREKPEIKVLAQEVLSRNGSFHNVEVAAGLQTFPARLYGGRYYPAGEYISLKITIGDGKGENWWCVIFPPFCFDVVPAPGTDNGDAVNENSKSGREERLKDGRNEKEENGSYKEENGRIEFRFWLLDLFR